ncbi:MAG: DDE-type integrase/transposase/recombinase [Thermoplasmata archaeon]
MSKMGKGHINSLWQMGWLEYDGKNYIVIEDDASRFIIQFGEFDHASAENSSLEALKKVVEKYGKPREVMTDQGTQFPSLERDEKESEPNEFQKYLKENGIIHIKARIKCSQTKNKLEKLIFKLENFRKYIVA